MRYFAFCFAILVGLMTTGCGDGHPTRYAVKGEVLFEDGEPVRTGVVEFIPKSSDSPLTASGSIQANGSYQLSCVTDKDGAVAGEYKVIVKQIIVTEKLALHEHNHGGNVDPLFSDERTTPLQATVEKKANVINFKVKRVGEKP